MDSMSGYKFCNALSFHMHMCPMQQLLQKEGKYTSFSLFKGF